VSLRRRRGRRSEEGNPTVVLLVAFVDGETTRNARSPAVDLCKLQCTDT
jgi:hypothetical protein